MLRARSEEISPSNTVDYDEFVRVVGGRDGLR
jgi:hypothetical protein